MNKLLLFLFRRQYKKRLLNAARDIALGKEWYMCVAIGNLRYKLPLFNQEEFSSFVTKRYPELTRFLTTYSIPEISKERLPWIDSGLVYQERDKHLRLLLHWVKSEYLEWIAYNI